MCSEKVADGNDREMYAVLESCADPVFSSVFSGDGIPRSLDMDGCGHTQRIP